MQAAIEAELTRKKEQDAGYEDVTEVSATCRPRGARYQLLTLYSLVSIPTVPCTSLTSILPISIVG